MLVSHIEPLDLLPRSLSCWELVLLGISKFVLSVTLPCNVLLIYIDRDTLGVEDLISVCEETLSNEPARDGGIIIGKNSYLIDCLIIGSNTTKVFIKLDGIAISELICVDVVSLQLVETARLHISTMVLIKVI